jgi:hypothetical protein
MSLPLKRRMARVALLVAAAAPVIGLGASSASAVGLPQATDLGGLSNTDAASALGGNVDDTAHQAVGVANTTGGNAAKNLVPATTKTLDGAGQTLTPVAKKTVGNTADQVGRVAGHTAESAQGGEGLTGQLPTSGLSGTQLPTQGLHNGPMLPPINGLPAV